jgi:hypothetical protein
MPSDLRRSRMVSLRLSLDEYERCLEICRQKGVHDISDLARKAIQQYIATETQRDPVAEDVARLRKQLFLVSAELDRLYKKLGLASLSGNGLAATAAN